MKFALTMTHCTRPRLTEASLRHVRECTGSAAWTFLPRVEPDDAAVVRQVAEFCAQRPKARITVNPYRLGVNANTLAAIDDAFDEGADFVVHVEDDVLLATDALAYFAWCAKRFAPDPSIATVAAYNRRGEQPPETAWHAVESRDCFHPWGWGTWCDRWEALRRAVTGARPTWDCQVRRAMFRTGRLEVFPTLSRAQNIGLESSVSPGEHTREWYAENHNLRHWAGDVVVPRGRFRPAPVRSAAAAERAGDRGESA